MRWIRGTCLWAKTTSLTTKSEHVIASQSSHVDTTFFHSRFEELAAEVAADSKKRPRPNDTSADDAKLSKVRHSSDQPS